MNKFIFIIIVIFVLFFASCQKNDKNSNIIDNIRKGPFISDTVVTISDFQKENSQVLYLKSGRLIKPFHFPGISDKTDNFFDILPNDVVLIYTIQGKKFFLMHDVRNNRDYYIDNF